MSETNLKAMESINDSAAEQTSGSVDKIRDILFGTQIKSYEARFSRLEESIARELAEMKDASARRFESLESFMQKENRCAGVAAEGRMPRAVRATPRHCERSEDQQRGAEQEDSRSQQQDRGRTEQPAPGLDEGIAQTAGRHPPEE